MKQNIHSFVDNQYKCFLISEIKDSVFSFKDTDSFYVGFQRQKESLRKEQREMEQLLRTICTRFNIAFWPIIKILYSKFVNLIALFSLLCLLYFLIFDEILFSALLLPWARNYRLVICRQCVITTHWHNRSFWRHIDDTLMMKVLSIVSNSALLTRWKLLNCYLRLNFLLSLGHSRCWTVWWAGQQDTRSSRARLQGSLSRTSGMTGNVTKTQILIQMLTYKTQKPQTFALVHSIGEI